MRALGLDPSLRAYGWCVYDSGVLRPKDRLVASGHDGTLPTTVPVARFMHYRSLVRDILSRFRVDVVGIESPAYGGGPFSETHFGLMMYTLEAVFERRIDCVLFDPVTVKLLTGSGSATKSDVQRFVQADRMSPDVVQGDEADAYCIGKFASRFKESMTEVISKSDLTERELRVFYTRKKKVKTLAGTRVKRVAHAFRENSRFFQFSKVPEGSVDLPSKSAIEPALLKWLEDSETVEEIMRK
jgi:Holliday junction resolvasome RuvABC endonuclease subunit